MKDARLLIVGAMVWGGVFGIYIKDALTGRPIAVLFCLLAVAYLVSAWHRSAKFTA